MEIGILPTNLGAVGVYLTKDLDYIIAMNFGFNIGDISYLRPDGTIEYICTSCWSAGTNYRYKLTKYFSTTLKKFQ